jgi:hypothetical protein
VIFGRNRKRSNEQEAEDAETTATESDPTTASTAEEQPPGDSTQDAADVELDAQPGLDVETLDATEWRTDGPFDIVELHDQEDEEQADDQVPRIDLGSLILTGLPGSELRLQVSEETQQIVSAMLVLQTAEPGVVNGAGATVTSSALELSAYAAPRSGGLWAELRDEISESATAAGGSAALAEGPFGVELRRLIPVTTPEGEQGYQPSRMWVAEGPRWLLRGIVYGQAAIEEDLDAPSVQSVLTAFRSVVVRRGDEAMAPGDLLPLTMPDDLAPAE